MADCIFCKIVSGEIKGDVVYRDDQIMAFRDLNPQAPTHVLIVPNDHLESIRDLDGTHAPLAGRLIAVANQIADQEGLHGGYRLLSNVGLDAGQSVPHLHWHLLGGRKLGWPPG